MVFLSYHNKILQIGWLKQCFLMDIKSKIKVLSGLVPEKGSLFGLQNGTFLAMSSQAFPQCVYLGRERSLSYFPYFEGYWSYDVRPTVMAKFNSYYLLLTPFPNITNWDLWFDIWIWVEQEHSVYNSGIKITVVLLWISFFFFFNKYWFQVIPK